MTISVIDTGILDMLIWGMFLFLLINTVLFYILYKRIFIVIEGMDIIGDYIAEGDKNDKEVS